MRSILKLFTAIFTLVVIGQVAAVDPNFEFWNKLSTPTYAAVGTAPTVNQLMVFNPGARLSTTVNPAQKTQLLIADKKNPDVAFLYEFTPNKTIFIRLRAEGKGSKLEPQSGTLLSAGQKTDTGYSMANNVKPADIKLIKMIGQPAPKKVVTVYQALKIRPSATDAEILNIKDLADKAGVRKAFQTLSLQWHPDKIERNKRFNDVDLKDLSYGEKVELATEVFKLIKNAYERRK